uniref:BTB domain-containing protein n=1 Tax=Meloidogyne incognita TaxID=6306 RepID=A0A914KSV1_MELIC
MLEYFYCGEIDKRTVGKHSEDLFAIAHKYQVNQLMDICENYMAANIAAENLSNRCLFAELYNLSKLSKACINFLSANKQSFLACVNFLSANKQSFLVSREWKEFKSLNNDLAIRLLESLALNEEKQTEKKQVVNPFGCQNCEHRNLTTRLFASKPVHSGYLSTQQCAGSLPFASPQHINQTFGTFQ